MKIGDTVVTKEKFGGEYAKGRVSDIRREPSRRGFFADSYIESDSYEITVDWEDGQVGSYFNTFGLPFYVDDDEGYILPEIPKILTTKEKLAIANKTIADLRNKLKAVIRDN